MCGMEMRDVGYVKVTDLSFSDAVVFYRPLFCHFCLIVSRGMRWIVIPREPITPHHTVTHEPHHSISKKRRVLCPPDVRDWLEKLKKCGEVSVHSRRPSLFCLFLCVRSVE